MGPPETKAERLGEVVTAIVGFVGIGLGAFLSYVFEERRSKNETKRQVALRVHDEKVASLKSVSLTMMECAFRLTDSANRFPQTRQEYLEGVVQPLERFRQAYWLNGAWLSSIETQVGDALRVFNETALGIQARSSQAATLMNPQSLPMLTTVPIPYDDLARVPLIANRAIADEIRSAEIP